MTEDDFKRIENLISRQVGVREESILHKLDLVVEGQQALAERMDRMDTDLRNDIHKLDERLTRVEVRLTRVENKVDGVASDLAAHRADTEAHRGTYLVREV